MEGVDETDLQMAPKRTHKSYWTLIGYLVWSKAPNLPLPPLFLLRMLVIWHHTVRCAVRWDIHLVSCPDLENKQDLHLYPKLTWFPFLSNPKAGKHSAFCWIANLIFPRVLPEWQLPNAPVRIKHPTVVISFCFWVCQHPLHKLTFQLIMHFL